MTIKILFCILFVLHLNIYECRFRNDYKYYQEIDGWIKLHQVPVPWEDARLRCKHEGAMLASPQSQNMVTAMKHAMTLTHSEASGVFTGVHSTFSKGDFYSIDGIPLRKMPVDWMPSEPDNQCNSENCIVMIANGTIADVNCSEVFPYICYRKRTKNMRITECGTIDTEYVLKEKTGHCYKFHTTPRNWTRAYMICSAEGGYLGVINSDEEAEIFKELHGQQPASKLPYDTVFLGFHDWGESGVWTTVLGEELKEAGYAKFGANEPDNSPPGEHCGSMFRNGLFNDAWCHVNLAFICEKTVDSLLDEVDL